MRRATLVTVSAGGLRASTVPHSSSLLFCSSTSRSVLATSANARVFPLRSYTTTAGTPPPISVASLIASEKNGLPDWLLFIYFIHFILGGAPGPAATEGDGRHWSRRRSTRLACFPSRIARQPLCPWFSVCALVRHCRALRAREKNLSFLAETVTHNTRGRTNEELTRVEKGKGAYSQRRMRWRDRGRRRWR